MTEFVLISTTAGSCAEAELIATSLVEQRLAACVQIIPQVRSVYRWEDKIEQSDEWLCLVKTRRSLIEKIDATITGLHSYDCPELVVVPIEAASANYLSWLGAELSD